MFCGVMYVPVNCIVVCGCAVYPCQLLCSAWMCWVEQVYKYFAIMMCLVLLVCIVTI